MVAQLWGSITIGLAVSAVLFLPLLVWQYRRYGRFDGPRMLWTVAGYIYLSSIVAFTIFPIPDFSSGYCDKHQISPDLDIFRFPRELIHLINTKGVGAVATDWLIWEFALNMALFIPFGLIVRRVFEWPRLVVLAAALGTSILIELTQWTANWGLSPCPYRIADVTDLFTNTVGALLGIGLERITPRLLSTKKHLLAERDHARPVTRRRRMVGMLFDFCYLILAQLLGNMVGAICYALTQNINEQGYTPEQYEAARNALLLGSAAAVAAVLLVPALVGSGASLGQRTVYLCPVPPVFWSRGWLLLRVLAVQGVVMALFFSGKPENVMLGMLWWLGTTLFLFASPRGFSFLVARCEIKDVRETSSQLQ